MNLSRKNKIKNKKKSKKINVYKIANILLKKIMCSS